jgi:hypothetical protein
VDAIAITQIARPNFTAASLQLTSVPEPNTILGLMTVGFLSLFAIRKCDRTN